MPRPFWLVALIVMLSSALALPWWSIQYAARSAKYGEVSRSLSGRAVTVRYSGGEALAGVVDAVVPGKGLRMRGLMSSEIFLSCLWYAPEELTREERFSVVAAAFPGYVKYGSMGAVFLAVYLPVSFAFSRTYWWWRDRKRPSASKILQENSRTRYR